MRVPITLRLNADLLAVARAEAKRDSRTLTNLIEVALKRHLGRVEMERPAPAPGQDATGAPEGASVPAGIGSGRLP